MTRHDAFMADPAYRAAIKGVEAALEITRQASNADPRAGAQLVAMMALVAFTNAGGLAEPHVGRLARFAPDLGYGPDVSTADH